MATEEKKYLINIESNLDKYAKEADEARKKVEELTIENYKLKNSDTATSEELEKSNAALRVAQKEYKSAKTNLDNVTQANKAQSLSYDQLYKQWTLAQKELKSMSNAYTVNEKGVRVLSQEYIKQSKVVADAKKSLDQFGKGVNDNRLNVGNYSGALSEFSSQLGMLPGPMGRVIAGIKSMGSALKSLLLNPIVLLIAAIVASLYAMFKALQSTDKGATEFAARLEQLRAIVDVFRQRIITLASAIGNVFKGEWKAAAEDFKATITGVGNQLSEAAKGAYEYKYAIDSLEDSEANYVSRSAELKREIAKLEYTAQDRTKSTKEREKALREAIQLSEEELKKQKEFAKKRLDIEAQYLADKNGVRKEDVLAFITMTDEQQANASEEMKTLRNNNEDKMKELDKLYATWIDKDTQFYTEQKRNISRLSGFIDEERKQREAKQLKEREDFANAMLKQLGDEINAQLELYDKEDAYNEKRQLINEQNRLAIKESAAQSEFELKQIQLNNDREAEIAMAEKTGADVLLINEKYNNYQKVLDKEVAETKLQTYAEFAGAIAQLFGEQTAIGRIAAVAEAAISTYLSAQKAYASLVGIPIVGPGLAALAATTATLRGIASVKKILSVKSGLPGDSGGGSVPTAISSTPVAQRTFATGLPSSAITQPQMTQAQLNAAPQQQFVSAQEIANAISNLPPPVVTVEDINAKVKSMNKVNVRGII